MSERGNNGSGADLPEVPNVDERLSDWVDGRLSVRDQERFEAELRVNPRLRQQAEGFRRTVESVRAALRQPLDKIDLADRVLGAIAQCPPARRRSFARPLLFSAAAASLIAASLWYVQGLGRAAPDTTTSVDLPADAARFADEDLRRAGAGVPTPDATGGRRDGLSGKEGMGAFRSADRDAEGSAAQQTEADPAVTETEVQTVTGGRPASRPEATSPKEPGAEGETRRLLERRAGAALEKNAPPVPQEQAALREVQRGVQHDVQQVGEGGQVVRQQQEAPPAAEGSEFFLGAGRAGADKAGKAEGTAEGGPGAASSAKGQSRARQAATPDTSPPSPGRGAPQTGNRDFARTGDDAGRKARDDRENEDAQRGFLGDLAGGVLAPQVQVVMLTRRKQPVELQDPRSSITIQAYGQTLDKSLMAQFPSEGAAAAARLPLVLDNIQVETLSMALPDPFQLDGDPLGARQSLGNVDRLESAPGSFVGLARLVPEGARANAAYVEGDAAQVRDFLGQVGAWAGANRIELAVEEVATSEVTLLQEINRRAVAANAPDRGEVAADEQAAEKAVEKARQAGRVPGSGTTPPAVGAAGPAGPATPGPAKPDSPDGRRRLSVLILFRELTDPPALKPTGK